MPSKKRINYKWEYQEAQVGAYAFQVDSTMTIYFDVGGENASNETSIISYNLGSNLGFLAAYSHEDQKFLFFTHEELAPNILDHRRNMSTAKGLSPRSKLRLETILEALEEKVKPKH